jgi:hypothetical protein
MPRANEELVDEVKLGKELGLKSPRSGAYSSR